MQKYKLNHSQIFTALKRQLKLRSLHYRDLAAALKISEASVKRWFSQERLTLEQLTAILNFLNMTLTELGQDADTPPLRRLTLAQEEKLVSDEQLLLVASLTLRGWPLTDILEAFNLTEAQCIKQLLVLEQLRLIDLLPDNRIRLLIDKDFIWQEDGPLRSLVKDIYLRTTFNYPFTDENDLMMIKPTYLTTEAIQQLKTHIQKFRSIIAELELDSLNAPPADRLPSIFVAAIREWDVNFLPEYRRPRASSKQKEE